MSGKLGATPGVLIMKNILVVGAHFDDAELGAGGSMAKWVQEGKKVFKLTLTDNITVFKNRDIRVGFEDSINESARACDILGVNEVLHIPYERCTDLHFNKKQMQLIESFIFDNTIDTIVLHNIFDIQQDHVSAATISYVAGRYCDNIIAYQSNKYILPMDFYPRFFIDITKTIDLKIKALESYGYAHNRNNQLFEMTIKQNRVWGYQSTMNKDECYAEAFQIIKYIQR